MRTSLEETELGAAPSDELFMRLYEDLRKAVRYPGRTRMLRALEADREVLDLVSRASAQERSLGPGETWRAFFDALTLDGSGPEIWRRLAKSIAVPPEFTEVVYIYRNVTNGPPIEYREVLLSDLQRRFGNLPLQRYLERDVL